jgi:hypothetical protein
LLVVSHYLIQEDFHMLGGYGKILCFLSLTAAPVILARASDPVAYVYVTSNYSGSTNRLVGFSAGANGQLKEVPGTPWAENLFWTATNGKYLFGSDNVASDDSRNIYSYLIESNGEPNYVGATDIQNKGTGNSCNQGGFLTLDHTGSDLYIFVSQSNCDEEQAYQSFSINKETGLLNDLGTSAASEYLLYPLTVIANNQMAYAVGCNFNVADMQGFQRQSNGALVAINNATQFPTPPHTNSYWTECPSIATADTTNHLAIDFYYPDGENDRIATYNVNTTNGNLTTSSTYSNMSPTEVVSVRAMRMAPSGKLLAIGGTGGLQVFNFNPSGQARPHTGLLTTAPIDHVAWDNSNHVYGISNADSKLYVFTVTSTEETEAPGSPFAVTHPVALTVLPK